MPNICLKVLIGFFLSFLLVESRNETVRNCLKSDGRVLGGLPATFGQFPHEASVNLKTPIAEMYLCSGSIINRRSVLTVASCIVNQIRNLINVGVGVINFDDPSYITYDVKALYIPQSYKEGNKDNIAIVRINGYFDFNGNVQPVVLPMESYDDPLICHVTGWGNMNTELGIDTWRTLSYIEVLLMDWTDCQFVYGISSFDHRMICAITKRNQGICAKSVGSGLVNDGILIGIVSMTNSCYGGNTDIYINVYSYFNWINTNM